MSATTSCFVLIDLPIQNGTEKRLSDIQKFIDQRDFNFTSEELRRKIIRFIPLKTALEDWVETINDHEVKKRYRRAVERFLIDDVSPGKIKLNSSIECLDEISCHGIYDYILEELQVSESTKTLCITAYGHFCNFIRVSTYGIIDPELSPREQVSFRNAEKIHNEVEWNAFLNAVEMPYRMIAKLVYLSSYLWGYRLRLNDKDKNMLSLKIDQLDFKKNTITFQRDQSFHSKELTLPLPNNFMKDLEKLICEKESLVFKSSKGKEIIPRQVERAFIKASKKIKLDSWITPVTLCWAGPARKKTSKASII